MRTRPVLIAASLMLFAAHAMAAESIIGTWFGEGEPGNPNDVWLARVSPDGTFKVTFRMCRPSSTLLIDEGTWKVTGQQMEIIYTTANSHAVHDRDLYQILSNDGHRMQYKLTQSEAAPASSIGFVFTSNKVADDFQIPGCDFVS